MNLSVPFLQSLAPLHPPSVLHMYKSTENRLTLCHNHTYVYKLSITSQPSHTSHRSDSFGYQHIQFLYLSLLPIHSLTHSPSKTLLNKIHHPLLLHPPNRLPYIIR